MLATNCGVDPGTVLYKIESQDDPDYGFDAAALDYGSMLKKGIVDPAKVVRSGIQNAASVASIILTTECLIADLPEKKGPPAPPGGMGGMGGMDGMY